MKKIHFMLTAFRDGFQSVYGARVFSKDYLPVVEAAAAMGITHFESGGGAMFQSPYFYANEDAFAIMDGFRAAAGPKANLQTLARGISVVGLESQCKDMIRLHAKLFKKHGVTTIRNFDALNDVNNLIYSGKCITEAGLKHEITISMMELPPGCQGAHTAEFYIEVLKKIMAADIPYDSICFKDASGTSTAKKVFDTIKMARQAVGNQTHLVFHSHETAGNGLLSYKAAIDAGIDQIDLSLVPVSGGTCQPDILTMWHALRGTDYHLDVDINKVVKLSEFFKESMKDYFLPPESKEVEPQIIFFPMPGGALTANTQMLRDNKLMNKYAEMINAMGEAVQKGGFGTSATPVSQFYFQQAFNNVMFGPWKKIADGYGKMVLGYFGKTPVPPDKEVMAIAEQQLKLKPTTECPVDINDRDPQKGIQAMRTLLENEKLPVTDENIFIAATCKEKGIAFLKGKASIGVRKKADEKQKECALKTGPTDYVVTINQKPQQVTVSGNSVSINGVSYEFDIQEKSAILETKHAAPQSDEYKINSPLPGQIIKINKKLGDVVELSETILVMESMKMETLINAPVRGKITQISVKEGDRVESSQLLVRLETLASDSSPHK